MFLLIIQILKIRMLQHFQKISNSFTNKHLEYISFWKPKELFVQEAYHNSCAYGPNITRPKGLKFEYVFRKKKTVIKRNKAVIASAVIFSQRASMNI